MGGIRTERIGEQLRGELARLLRDEVSDPRVAMVSLTRVQVAPDLSTAAVFWSPLDPRNPDVARIAEGLASAAGFLRRRIAVELPLRRAPELRFRHDPSLALGAETLEILRELEPAREAGEAGDDE